MTPVLPDGRPGISRFITPHHARADRVCAACGSACLVERGLGPFHGYAAAIFRRNVVHDDHRCPHVGERWHDAAEELVAEAAHTRSPSVRRLILDDLDALRATAGAAPVDRSAFEREST